MSKSFPLLIYVYLYHGDWIKFKTIILSTKSTSTRPAFLLTKLGVYSAFVTELTPQFLDPAGMIKIAFVLDSSRAASSSHFAAIVTTVPTIVPLGT